MKKKANFVMLRPNKKCVSGNGYEKFTYYFYLFFILEKIHNFMHFERHFAFQNALNYIFFSENLKKFLGSPVNLRRVGLP